MTPTPSETAAFSYPPGPRVRRHGPAGYQDYGSYRPWLRDEFSFRCVYCLLREQWGRLTGEFDLDHFVPQALRGDQVADYANLLYACHACNLRKGQKELPDPSQALTQESLRVRPDGTLQAFSDDAQRLIRQLCLNSPKWVQWRKMWIRIIQLAVEHDFELYRRALGYPDELPDLAACAVPLNSRPEGIEQSCYAKRQRAELPEVYFY